MGAVEKLECIEDIDGTVIGGDMVEVVTFFSYQSTCKATKVTRRVFFRWFFLFTRLLSLRTIDTSTQV